jgi:sulfite reductase (NADPH) flavoprotein alpha-component
MQRATHRDVGNTNRVGNTMGATHTEVGNTNRVGNTIGAACGIGGRCSYSSLMLSETRIYAASAIALLYAFSCIYFLWIAPRRKSLASDDASGSSLLIAFASQTGFAEQLANQTARSLAAVGIATRLASLAEIRPEQLTEVDQALFIVSTTGEGDAPDAASAFVRAMSESSIGESKGSLNSLKYAVLALGDRAYANFCGFGHRLDQWFRHQGASAWFDIVEVDNGEPGALRHWQHQLSTILDRPELADWEAPRYERWQLTDRVLMNPGSSGDPCWHIELKPLNSETYWSAGDILEVDPHNSTWSQKDQPLPHREYSIASLPSEGKVHLLVREMRRPDGTLGLGSAWLTRAEIGHEIAARIRINTNFHPPISDTPLILIGNGTGIAGLRAVLKARIKASHHKNWLIFGERNRAHDAFYFDELQEWLGKRELEAIDYAFSRDRLEKRYVQHVLLERADRVREWIEHGAAIYVCGSLNGMAPGVHSALEQILSAESLERLMEEGRYRRDVY